MVAGKLVRLALGKRGHLVGLTLFPALLKALEAGGLAVVDQVGELLRHLDLVLPLLLLALLGLHLLGLLGCMAVRKKEEKKGGKDN